MWLGILTGLCIITKVHGYSNGNFPESCESMSPVHIRNGVPVSPLHHNSNDPLFEVLYQYDSGTVSLQSKKSTKFRGFMLQARKNNEAQPNNRVGKFIPLDDPVRLLTCSGSQASAVSQTNNQQKSLVRVKWSAEGGDGDIIFNATFVESRYKFYEGVHVTVTLPTPPPPTTPPTTTSTAEPSTTTSTAEPSTTTSTAESSTTTSTAESSTTTSTAESSTTTSTAESNTTTSTAEPSTSTSTTSRTTQDLIKDDSSNQTLMLGATVAVAWDIVFEGLKMELPIIVMILTNCPSYHINKKTKILCSLLCAAAEISAVTLFFLAESFNAILIALSCVVTLINLIELVIVSLPFGPSHELNEICDLAVKLCSVIHKILAITVVLVAVGPDDMRDSSWLPQVRIAYTVWISLFVIWIFVFATHGKEMLRKRQTGSSKSNKRWRQQRQKKKLTVADGVVITISAVFIIGTIFFTVAVNCGLIFLM